MCLNPITIKNPAFRQGSPLYYRKVTKSPEGDKIIQYKPLMKSIADTAIITDSAFSQLTVPCGTCPECMAKQQLYILQRCLEHFKGKHCLFCTNTYKSDMIRYIECGNRQLPIVDWHDFDTLIRLARRHNIFNRKFSYLSVSEYGGLKHRPHFHYFLFFDIDYEHDTAFTVLEFKEIWFKHIKQYWARNLGTRKNPVWKANSLFIRRLVRGQWKSTYDISPVVQSDIRFRLPVDKFLDDDMNVTFYVTKYILKYDEYVTKTQQWMRLNLSPEEYNEKWSLFRPSIHCSKGFGISDSTPDDVSAMVQDSLRNRDTVIPLYQLPDGRAVPLARYYRSGSKHNYLTQSSALQTHHDWQTKQLTHSDNLVPGSSSHFYDRPDPQNVKLKMEQFIRRQSQIYNNSLKSDL